MKDATPPAMQDRLLASLMAAIYGIMDALLPIIETIENTQTRPWAERTRFGDRFWAIIRELLALTIRIKPEILSTNPIFPQNRPCAPRPGRPARIRNTRPLDLTPRQLAKRLAALLHQLACLAAEAGAALTANFHHHANFAQAIAGCHALPPQTWERAG